MKRRKRKLIPLQEPEYLILKRLRDKLRRETSRPETFSSALKKLYEDYLELPDMVRQVEESCARELEEERRRTADIVAARGAEDERLDLRAEYLRRWEDALDRRGALDADTRLELAELRIEYLERSSRAVGARERRESGQDDG